MFVRKINHLGRRGLGEVVLRYKSIDDEFRDQQTRICLPGEIPEGFIVSFEEIGGNGCILKKLKNPVYIPELSKFGIALVITTAHIVCDPITGYLDAAEINCDIDGISVPLQCFPLKSFLKTVTECAICSTGYSYCLNEGDLAILLLLSPVSDININEIEIEQDKVSEGRNCFLSGKPFGMLTSLNYNYPYVESLEEARRRMQDIFHDPSQLIISEGIISSSEEFLELSCSTCRGLSGSPVIINQKLAGIFCAGPPLPGQKELLTASEYLHQGQLTDSWNSYCEFETLTTNYENFSRDMILIYYKSIFMTINEPIPVELQKFSAVQVLNIDELKYSLGTKMIELIRTLVKFYKKKDELSFNIALPSWGKGFKILLSEVECIVSYYENKSSMRLWDLNYFRLK